MKKNSPCNWTTESQQAFETPKQCCSSTPILIQPDVTKPFQLETDASLAACGAILSQQGSDRHWHPVAFLSKSFIEAECNYDIYDRELLAIIKALEEWHHYLEGSPHPITIISDHKNLTIFREVHKLTRQQARWALFLTHFNFIIKHMAGTQAKADALTS